LPPVLNLKPQDIDTNEKRSKYTVSVVGCGQRGVLWADAFAESGFTVICTDADQSLVKKLGKGKSIYSDPNGESKLKGFLNSGKLCTSSELKKSVSESDIVTLTLNVKIDDKNNPDYSEIESTCKQIGASLRQGSLFIYGGIIGVGLIEGLIKETLENTSGFKVGRDFALAYIPLNPIKTSAQKNVIDTEFMVAATDKASLETSSNILKTVSGNVKQVSDVKTLELATLFSITKQDINSALANELAMFCESAGKDYFNVLQLIDGGRWSFCPTISEEANKNETYLLNETTENLNVKLRLPALSRQINEYMVKHAVTLTQNALHSCGKALRRARVAVLGTANSQTATEEFIKSITMKGAKVSLYDPLCRTEPYDTTPVLKKSLNETVEGTDCIVILTGQDQFKRLNIKKLRSLMKSPAVLVDLVGLIEPEKIEKEGFIYCGLGRGIGKQ